MNPTFEQNCQYIKEAIEEVIKPEEIGSYESEIKRLYRARKFGWIQGLVDNIVEASKRGEQVLDSTKHRVLSFVAIHHLTALKKTKSNPTQLFIFYRWEKKMLKSLYQLGENLTVDEKKLAHDMITLFKNEIQSAEDKPIIKQILTFLSNSAHQLNLFEAAEIFNLAAQALSDA